MAIKNKVQLITYPDSLGGDLRHLNQVLTNCFHGLFEGGIHILPPFPSSGDRGFAPKNYLEIEPEFGDWNDIRAIGEKNDVLVDLMVNHISKLSPYFQDYLRNGSDSEYADCFITLDKLWEDGIPKQDDIDKIFLRRPVPYSTFSFEKTGEQFKVWTTFGKEDPSEQIDLDIKSPKVKEILASFFETFSQNNIKIVRLDAVGYVIKKLGTSCFFVEPEIYQFLEWVKELADHYEIEILPEVHSNYDIQLKLAEQGYWIYDFILPYTVLETMLTKSSKRLKEYLKDRPEKQFTMLDCHDGIPVLPDLEGKIDTKKASEITQTCKDRGANFSVIVSDEHKAADGFDVHQINGTYYSLLNSDDAYLASRAIQFFVPGIPQVYYVGLLAGENDFQSVEETGENRAINRHNYTQSEIEESVGKAVVKRLLKLIQFRNEYPAFDGEFSVMESNDKHIKLKWVKKEKYCELHIDLNTYRTVIHYLDEQGKASEYVL
ncbi:sucrose phosphorylase [Gracilibacillus salitolerans]|uniref:Sucrose phosphorylase n=1 Tax=Gracilibacillus salitolerans TaxID=2663022 RepID=A0A5Q2TGC4_9BACI|nr:sucrose phosphorylase [Gracilibacillus salitolerans]QGH33665.1 sucrose phosphorylase [Gracilibacillus salitolerans]